MIKIHKSRSDCLRNENISKGCLVFSIHQALCMDPGILKNIPFGGT